MNQITLTERGKDILTGVNTNDQYWVGYFGLAYVPVQNTVDPETDTDLGLGSLNTLVGEQETGDYIYNIWQGDLTGGGYRETDADFTRLTQYDANLSTNFRYAYDEENGCNRLVAWTTAGKAEGEFTVKYDSYDREGYKVYTGCTPVVSDGSDTATVTYSESGIPVPAPLIYLGAGLGYGGNMQEMEEELGDDWPKTGDGYPMVTPDMRCYSGKDKDSGLSDGDIIESEDTRTDSGTLEEYRCFVSISNFNKGHAQVSSEGYETDYQESCHNMSRVTKLFPIAKYEVTDADPETKETRTGNAKSIKYRLSLDFGGDNRAYRDVLNFEGSDEYPVFAENPNNSFKFNRVGIYAVPVSVRKFRKEGQAGCNHCQVEVDPDENPVLVAIISLDEVLLSEDGSKGFTRWSQDFILNLENADSDAGCVKDVEVYYNMAENEAITWYQNQLLASAGLSEAVTSLGVDVAYLKSRAATPCSDCATSQSSDYSSVFAPIHHTHDYLRNLVDADAVGAVRGITSDESTEYGVCSFTMGTDSKTPGDQSITVGAGSTNGGDGCLLLGTGSNISGGSSRSVIIGDDNGTGIVDLNNVLIIGNGVLPDELNDASRENGIAISNVSVLGGLGGSVLKSVGTGPYAWSTGEYRDAHIFLNSSYSNPALFGIFPYPDNPVGLMDIGPYIPIVDGKFSSPDADGVYSTTDAIDSWANGMTRSQIKDLVNKPETPMIYTGGIGLTESKIKLGNSFHSCSYISSSAVDTWFAGRDFIDPVIVTGTDKCPFNGLLLGIGPDQDIDGTMKLVLYKQPSGGGLTKVFDSDSISGTVVPEIGKRYGVSNEVTLEINNTVPDGAEFILVNRKSYNIHFPNIGADAIALNGDMDSSTIDTYGTYLFRAASYIVSDTIHRGYIVTEIKSNFS